MEKDGFPVVKKKSQRSLCHDRMIESDLKEDNFFTEIKTNA
jgi:hypothetical protein